MAERASTRAELPANNTGLAHGCFFVHAERVYTLYFAPACSKTSICGDGLAGVRMYLFSHESICKSNAHAEIYVKISRIDAVYLEMTVRT